MSGSTPSDAITLRPATPDDAREAAPLIREAGPALFDRVFGPRPDDAVRFFERLFARSDVPFSYQSALVAVQGGEVVGLALAAPAWARRQNSWRMLYLLPRYRGLWAPLRLLPVVRAFWSATTPPPPRGVLPQHPGRPPRQARAGHRRPAAGSGGPGGGRRPAARWCASTPNWTTPGRVGSTRGTATG